MWGVPGLGLVGIAMFSKSQTKNMSTVSELHSWQRKSIGFNSRLTTESSLVFICSHPPLPSRQMKLLCPDLSTLNITIWLTAPPTRTTTHLYLRLVYLLHRIHINISNSGTSLQIFFLHFSEISVPLQLHPIHLHIHDLQ